MSLTCIIDLLFIEFNLICCFILQTWNFSCSINLWIQGAITELLSNPQCGSHIVVIYRVVFVLFYNYDFSNYNTEKGICYSVQYAYSDEPDTGYSSLILESLKPITNKSRLNFHTDPQIHRILPAGPVSHHNQSITSCSPYLVNPNLTP